MLMTIDHISIHNPIEDFVDSLADRNLTCYASDLLEQQGCQSLQELSDAVKRATEVCNCMHVPLQENFKVVYRSRNGEVVQDWRLSRMAYLLTALNADSRNAFVAQLQLEMVKQMLHHT
ncbi:MULTISPECIES: hypothetical protein [Pontibacter]|uniref:Uncharacterized protein n=1 Tax=Pontibacter lucknowensis TaxID=1077936 RepID=A0A1N6WTE8_9BACT|nr:MULTISPECIES: hypothetical protein [Pontibacter]SIQ93318.1 hypothetical protein SAMN05421545_1741 [Pontibacter lucknowensis]